MGFVISEGKKQLLEGAFVSFIRFKDLIDIR